MCACVVQSHAHPLGESPGRGTSSGDSRVSRPASAFAHATSQGSFGARDIPFERDTGVVSLEKGNTMNASHAAAVGGCLLISTLAGAAEPEDPQHVVVTATRASE